MKTRICFILSAPFMAVGCTLISFGDGGIKQVIKDWRDFFKEA